MHYLKKIPALRRELNQYSPVSAVFSIPPVRIPMIIAFIINVSVDHTINSLKYMRRKCLLLFFSVGIIFNLYNRYSPMIFPFNSRFNLFRYR